MPPSGGETFSPNSTSRYGHAFIDHALYLPKTWTDDPPRLAAAHVPPDAGFATKPRLAGRMIERAIAAEVPFAPRLPMATAAARTDRPKADG